MDKLFEVNALSIWRDGVRHYAIYDAGSHQVAMRKDEITEEEALEACKGPQQAIKMLRELQARLSREGINPYSSNYSVPE